jgi:hypothetical protein
MTINPRFYELVSQYGMDQEQAELFCLLWWGKRYFPGVEDKLFSNLADGRSLLNFEDEEPLRINLLELNPETGDYDLKFNLFVEDAEASRIDRFEEFCKLLAETREMNSMGHVNNPQSRAVYSVNKATREAFYEIEGKVEDLSRLVTVVLSYYRSVGEFVKNLPNYLRDHALLDYDNFTEGDNYKMV